MPVAVCVLIATILLFDQSSKLLVLQYIGLDSSIPIIKNILSVTPTLNTGGGFSILQNQTYLLIIISIFTILFIAYILFVKKFQDKVLTCAVSMILAGALGNLIDRIRLGAVIDFIDFKIWPIFNIADSFITIGFLLLVFHLLKSKPKIK